MFLEMSVVEYSNMVHIPRVVPQIQCGRIIQSRWLTSEGILVYFSHNCIEDMLTRVVLF